MLRCGVHERGWVRVGALSQAEEGRTSAPRRATWFCWGPHRSAERFWNLGRVLRPWLLQLSVPLERIAAVDPDTTPPAFYTTFGVSSASPALSLIAKGGGVGYQAGLPFLTSTCCQRSAG
jgi:hypothetical protein